MRASNIGKSINKQTAGCPHWKSFASGKTIYPQATCKYYAIFSTFKLHYLQEDVYFTITMWIFCPEISKHDTLSASGSLSFNSYHRCAKSMGRTLQDEPIDCYMGDYGGYIWWLTYPSEKKNSSGKMME
jgi:hypothetical protein